MKKIKNMSKKKHTKKKTEQIEKKYREKKKQRNVSRGRESEGRWRESEGRWREVEAKIAILLTPWKCGRDAVHLYINYSPGGQVCPPPSLPLPFIPSSPPFPSCLPLTTLPQAKPQGNLRGKEGSVRKGREGKGREGRVCWCMFPSPFLLVLSACLSVCLSVR